MDILQASCADIVNQNPFLALNYEPALESLGDDYYDLVAAAEFPKHILRFRNNDLLSRLGLESAAVSDEHFLEAFGRFQGRQPFLALRYHGYQFGTYNPQLGDGRGFLYGQVRGTDGDLYDFGTKGSGMTPWSRGGDGRLTLKGGVREVLAAEALHALGVKTSRCLSLVETGEQLWRGDEPSPTRSSVMIRFSRSHIRFGTFERYHYLGRRDLVERLLGHVIAVYYPHLLADGGKNVELPVIPFYRELVQRVATLVAQWVSVGFCHAVLNTDNMSITGESFDYGPYAFTPTYNRRFTAAYFDHYGRYCYGNQAPICKLNLELLQKPLGMVADLDALKAELEAFDEHFRLAYLDLMVQKLGFDPAQVQEPADLVRSTLELLQVTQVNYGAFFSRLRRQFLPEWRDDIQLIPLDLVDSMEEGAQAPPKTLWETWRDRFYHALQNLNPAELGAVQERLDRTNGYTYLTRPHIEAVWAAIDQADDWEPFYALVQKLQNRA
ncbi:MAG: protein adenylyltransferase SelO [Prochlorothrix sp.]